MSLPASQTAPVHDAPAHDEALLQDAFGDSDPAMLLELVRSMEDQLAELYGGTVEPREPLTPADLSAVYDAVGVTSAAEFVELVRSMEEQLTAFFNAAD
ncbi:MAG: hypothetical protein AAGG50_09125 [Bacteroidota bacterium]